MELGTIFQKLWELGPFVALMGVIVYVLYNRNNALEKRNDLLQEDKLALTKALGDVTNVANRHIETSNEFMKSWPQVLATAISASQDKIISEIRSSK